MSEWISIKDRFPPDNEIVLAWSKEDDRCILASLDTKDDNNWHCCYHWDTFHTRFGITHWMPLPERPIDAS